MLKMSRSGIYIVMSILVVIVTNVQGQAQFMIFRFRGREYAIFNITETFSEMETVCKSIGSIIAPARTQAENNFLFYVRDQFGLGNSRMWIGGDDRNGIDGVYFWSDGSPLTFTNWIGSEPKNAGGKEDCMVMEAEFTSTEGEWNDISCEEFKHTAICMKFEDTGKPIDGEMCHCPDVLACLYFKLTLFLTVHVFQ